MTDPPVVPARWRIWQNENIGGFAGEAALIEPEKPAEWLNDPVISRILETAMRERLPRSTGWEAAGNLPVSVQERLRLAASIYKRGVAFRPSGAEWQTTSLNGTYPVRIVSDHKVFAPLLAQGHFVVVDRNVHAAHPQIFAVMSDATVIGIDEHEKQLASVARLVDAWEKSGKPPEWSIFGGGIVTDTAAFAASLCGSRSIFVPTTLLAMADACVGGKTGVNFRPFGKNLLGHFYFPSLVVAWPGWLRTLDSRQLNAGAFECIKHYFLKNNLSAAGRFATAVKNLNLAAVETFLPEVIQVKADVVAEDPAETGKRAILNFGHTLGHAVEGLSQELTKGGDTILHGEAVGLGMAFAVFLSGKVASLEPAAAAEHQSILRTTGGLATRSQLTGFLGGKDPGSDEVTGKLSAYITQDKKASHDSSVAEWVLLTKTGQLHKPHGGHWLTPVPMKEFPVYWREFIAGLS